MLALLGPSGCGKTTTLRMVAGFERPDAGKVLIGGEDVTRLRPAQRRLGMVFQNYSLFPHMTVAENIAALGAGTIPAIPTIICDATPEIAQTQAHSVKDTGSTSNKDVSCQAWHEEQALG